MAGYRHYIRRLKHLAASPAFLGILICLCLLTALQCALRYGHSWYGNTFTASAEPTASVEDPEIDWSKLVYVQHVTSPEYLCNALMVWSQIETIGSRAKVRDALSAIGDVMSVDHLLIWVSQRLMMYPSHWDPTEIDDLDPERGLTHTARLLQAAEKDYYVTLHPVEVLNENNTSQSTWASSYSKLLSFNLTSYSRILSLDAASIVLQNLDELFLLPKAPIAMPYTYWGGPSGWAFSSQLMLLEPSSTTFSAMETAIKDAKEDEYDVDIINKLYKGKVLKIPQRPYNLLSGEFRRANHRAYLGSRSAKWDPDDIFAEARYLHFSDWPIPKPWMSARRELLNKYMPRCSKSEWFGATDCRDRTIWLKLYADFAATRRAVCGPGFEMHSQDLPAAPIYRHGRWFHPDDVE
ncbi:uncharacterized protein BP5553_00637 [Venustampulla echinocandica]|uniref:Nucleotide-diphospho-sugar transferase n=1 Tax=Venustampulla echinocandica TaxID=2656787 RepID=A0A370TYR9_9HELO|nr:uncharacterized protein BP5553_00637 [Venustampulla echinocandica]RDL40658.1 hypothetical protein BP5553_00637 [Venustampulla echinocandica]